jgi:DNA-binding PadR family transcriptional regulator
MSKQSHESPNNVTNRNIKELAAEASLTEIEGVILGIVWSRQPCSSYVVLTRFRQSPTWGWSSSAGAIYPAIRRMKSRRLLDARLEEKSKRRAELLALTERGCEALRDWLTDMSEEMGSAGVDPIRTRVNYLAALDAAERERFIDRAEAITRSRLDLVRQRRPDPKAAESWTLEATTMALVLQLEARITWLKALRPLARRAGRS